MAEGTFEKGAHAARDEDLAQSLLSDIILQTIAGLAVVLDRQGRIVRFNQACERATGYSFAEVKGRHLWDFLLPADEIEGVRAVFEALKAGQFPNKYKNHWLTKDGGSRLIAWSNSAVVDDDGEVAYVIGTGADITEQRQAEEALRWSREDLDRAQAVAQTGSWRLDVRRNELVWSDETYRMFGIPAGTPLTYEAFLAVVHPEDRERVDRAWQAALRGAPYDVEHRIVVAGEVKWVRERADMEVDERGAPVGGFGTVQDVTERKQAAEERERLLAELEATVEAVAAGVIAFDQAGKITRLNAAAARMLGLSADDLGLPVAELFARLRFESADGRPLSLAEFPPARALRGERVGSAQMAFLKGEQKVWIYDGAEPVRARDGSILGAVVSFVDVTELRELQEQQRRLLSDVQRRAAELQTILDSMVDGVLVYDAEGRIVLANAFTRQLLDLVDLPGGEAIVAKIPERARLRHLDGTPIAPEETASARALAGQTVSAQAQIAHNWRTGRDVYVSTSAAPLWTDEGKVGGAVVVVRDVTELVELDRLKDEFIAVAAHELKTPVAIMKGYAQALPLGLPDLTPQTRKMLEAIDRGADRIGGIVDDLLDVSRLLAGGLEMVYERVDLRELVEAVVDRAAVGAPNHRLVLKAQPVVVRGDRARLEQVLANLLDNAIRYSPAGGDVEVELAVRGDEAVVSVRDHGIGIPKERQGRIFQRFYRAHTRTPYDYGGTGVGLYISKEIVASHGGRMWFTSEEGVGSTFAFSLPLRGKSE